MKIKPFQRVNRFTLLDNYFWDHFMPSVPANAWRIFCYLYRQTAGWGKEETALTLAQIQSGAGCRSPKTAKKMIQLLQKRGVIIVKFGNRYALNTNFEVKITVKNTDKKAAKNTDSVKSTVKNAVKNADYKKKKEKKEKKRSDDDVFFTNLIQPLVETLTNINKQLPAKSTPLSGLPILAEQLAQRGETSETARAAWQTCQKRARNPLGAFLVWCRDNYLPIGSGRKASKNEPPASEAPAAKKTKQGGKSRELGWQ